MSDPFDPAFPALAQEIFLDGERVATAAYIGLSKREYAAIAICQGVIAGSDNALITDKVAELFARESVCMADALLAALAAAAGEPEGDRPAAAEPSEADEEPESEELSFPMAGAAAAEALPY